MANIPGTGSRLLRVAGVLVWLLSGIPAVQGLIELSRIAPAAALLWICAFAVFGASFWAVSGAVGRGNNRPVALALLVLESAAALLMFHTICTGFETILLVLVAAQVGLMLPLRHTIPWILIQTALLAWLSVGHWGPDRAFSWSLAGFAMQIFSLLISSFAGNEARARLELARANAELQATRELLAHGSRAAERVRIARELHDLMGHDLTALNLNLEAAIHRVEQPETREPVARAQRIAKRMLADVRKVVSALRQEPPIDLASAFASLAEGVHAPAVHLRVSEELNVPDPEIAHVLIRCAQEIITNAIRHAEADNLWIEIVQHDGSVELRARDDGRGASSVRPGNGLSGMRERVEHAGGRLSVTTEPRRGFEVVVVVPMSRGVA